MNRIEAQRWEAALADAQATTSAAAGAIGLQPLLREWLERRRLRRALAQVPARDLLDAGLSIAAVEHEVAQPFWRPLDRERK